MKKNKKVLKRIRPIAFLVVLLIIVAAFFGAIYYKKFIGFVSLQTEAGTISEINIKQVTQSYAWQGFYGVALMVAGYTSPQDGVAQKGGMTEKNLLFACLPPNTGQAIYASIIDPEEIDFESLTAASQTDIDNFLGYHGWEADSANQTLTQTISVKIGNDTIANLPATYTYQLDNPGSTTFDLGFLKDGSGNIIVATHLTSFESGFNGKTYNYQMFVPVPNGSNPKYNFWVDPNNNCPGGLGAQSNNATVRGIVLDNETKLPIQYVLVASAGSSVYTDNAGFYSITVPGGAQIIVAQKTGYSIYVGNFSIQNGEVLEYNITMTKEESKGNGTGTGVGPGIGPGIGTGTGSGTGSGVGTGFGPGVSMGTGPGVDVGPEFFKQSLTGIGPGIGPYTEAPKKIEGMDHWVSLKEINTKLRVGNFLQNSIYIYRFSNGSADLTVSVDDSIKDMVTVDNKEIKVDEGKFANFTVTLFGNKDPGIYQGKIKIDGSFNETIDVRIEVTNEDKMQVQSLLIDVSPARPSEAKGNVMKFKITLQNLLIDDYYDVLLSYNISSVDGKDSFVLPPDKIKLQTTTTVVKAFEVPQVPIGDYVIRVYAHYVGIKSYASAIFTVTDKFLMIILFWNFRMWHLLLLLFLSGSGFAAYKIIKQRIESKKRFHVQLEYNELPKPGSRSAYIGKIAETNVKAYFDLDKLTVHSIVAGTTGGGKSVSAQVLIEEALLKGVAVIVFDPTAQWSGMLRKNVNERMLGLYAQYGMKPKDAQGFNGNVRQILDKNEIIDIKKYMKPGEIQILSMNKLDPVDVDVFVANSVKEVFHANFDESQTLRLLLVYDEVHRLLPKFGGAGLGFLQIERGCREFRKWGIGIILISQVLADFIGQIKANINTEIQMRTSDENDLERIKSKYGPEFLQSLVKSPVGSGMLVNPAFNRGRPYFVAFRPLLHSIARLSDKELENYNRYNGIIDDLEDQLEQLEKEKVDVFDLKLELKLALDKVKTGNFNMVSIYLDGLLPQIMHQWEKLGKGPERKKKKVADETDLKAEMDKAQKEREKFDKEQAAAKPTAGATSASAAKPTATVAATSNTTMASTTTSPNPNSPTQTQPTQAQPSQAQPAQNQSTQGNVVSPATSPVQPTTQNTTQNVAPIEVKQDVKIDAKTESIKSANVENNIKESINNPSENKDIKKEEIATVVQQKEVK